ncbi:FRG domain-containing protein [Frankineae bacterium MT45]|nr:FRG domain-containing protein [Frankineae bacterium MT45]
MQVQAVDHFSLVETVVSKTSELVDYFTRIEALARQQSCDVYWRGQADQSWSVTSSLVRRMSSDALTDGELRDAEASILQEAQRWMSQTAPDLRSDLEWLAYLQHNWVPTRLLDFTPDPLVATFFACESLDMVDGRVFAVLVKNDQKPVLDGSTAYEINKTPSGQVRVFRPRPQVSPRLAAQSGVFILGKLPSTHVNRWVKDEFVRERQMLKDEVASIMSLPFYFRREDQAARPTSLAVAAYTARIHINKASVRRELRREGPGNRNLKPTTRIDHAYCYPDVDGMRRYSRTWEKVFVGASQPTGAYTV